MQLLNNMWLRKLSVRIRKVKTGFVVEIEQRKWFGKKYWTHLISVSGIDSEPWVYSNFDTALEQAKKYLEWDIIINSRT